MKKRILSLILLAALVLGLSSAAAAAWESFRGSRDNMAVTTAPMPTNPAKATEKWCTAESFSAGSGWNINNPAPMLLVDGKIITTCGEELLELNRETGEVLRRTPMAAACGTMGNSAPVYGGGMIFMPLQDGRVQAFDAAEFKAVWISEVLGSQCTTGLVYDSGFVFGCTGNGSGSVFSLAEAAGDAAEENTAVWNVYAVGDEQGSYFSTPIVTETAVVYGTDSGFLCSRDRTDGTLLSRLELPGGKQRSGIALYEGRVYGGTSTGYLFSAALATDGTLSDLKAEKDEAVSSITSTPVIYNGVVYYGGSKMVVAADAGTLKTLRTSGTTGFEQELSFGGAVQCSLLLHPGEDAVYLYATQNCPPGGLYLVKDDGTEMTASALHTPAEEKQEYCLASPICDEKGTIYYRNDSGYIFAVAAERETGAPQNPPQDTPPVPPQQETVTASVSVVGHLGTALYPKTEKQLPTGATAYDILLQTGLDVDAVSTEYGIYVRAIGGLAEKSVGEGSGWLYEVNGESPMVGASDLTLQNGDAVCWKFTVWEQPAVPVIPSRPVQTEQKEPEKEAEEAEPAALPYVDVQTHWGAQAIRFVTEKGLMKGVSIDSFAPDESVTRSMVMTVLARMAGTQTEGGTTWYEKAMGWAKEQRISDGSDPEKVITREQLVTMLYRYAGMPEIKSDLSKCSDAAHVSEYAAKAMAWAVENGIITGLTETTLAPKGEATRAQLAAVLMRFAAVLEDKA